ncbi:MAG: amino acid permease [Deltaproteobacteria bacterium]|nr:amino acid permease [Deltaproteobacteria bacterium]MBI3293733.1 amino acid permease [Deltaproteobacteria bacterium]
MNSTQVDQDISDLNKFGYVQELLREMGGFTAFAISFSVISILTGATQLFGYGLTHGGPFQICVGWTIVSIFTFFVALAMAELASSFPTAGAVYHWSHILGGRTLGWFTAALNTIGQFALMAGIDYGLAQFIFGIVGVTATPAMIFALFSMLLFSHAILNHRGIHIVGRLNDFSAWYHILVVAALVGALLWRGTAQPVDFLLQFSSTDGFSKPYSFFVGLLVAQWTLCGYDAAAHVTEETVDPRRRAPWGIVLSVVVSVLAGAAMLFLVVLSIPDLAQAHGFGDAAFQEILKLRLGVGPARVMSGLIAGAMWLCGLASMTSASRMVYAFARDGGLPFAHLWATISPEHRTPSNAIWGLSAFALLLSLSVDIYSAIVSIATITLYLSYGLPIVARVIGEWRGRPYPTGPWNLGRIGTLISIVAVVWIAIITVAFVLPPNQQAGVAMAVVSLLLLGLWVFQVRKTFVGPKFAKGIA